MQKKYNFLMENKLNLQNILSKISVVNSSRLLNLDAQKIYTCFIGATGASKSSLISYIIDFSHMTYEKKGLNYLLKHQENSSLPKIGNTVVSETELPELFTKGDINLLDLPGLYDTKGPEQEMVNAYTSSLLFKKYHQFRFVIVVEVSTLLERKGGKLADLIRKMEDMFGEALIEIAKSACLVISKVNQDQYPEEDLIGQLKEIAKGNSYLPENSVRRIFLDSLIDSKKICFFSIPKQLTPEKITVIEKSITLLPSFELNKNFNFNPSEETKKRLQDMINEICNQIKEKFNSIGAKIKSKYMRTQCQLQEAESCKSTLTVAEQILSGITNWKELRAKTVMSVLNLNLEQNTSVDIQIEKLKQLSDIFPDISVTFDINFLSIREAVTSSKSQAITEIARIKNQMEVERIRRENYIRAENDRIRREEELRRVRQESQRRAREERERFQREQRRLREEAQKKLQIARQEAQNERKRILRQKQEQDKRIRTIEWIERFLAPIRFDLSNV